jgi:hypothetical protein
MCVRPIWGFDRDHEARAARAAGWRRGELWWERMQEAANRDLAAGRRARAVRGFRRAGWLARLRFSRDDPRRATSLANAAFAARVCGRPRRAARLYAAARRAWAEAPAGLERLEIRPRARSSLFHLRMEVLHWRTYRATMEVRLGRFVAEADAALAALAAGLPAPTPLFPRWLGEKPPVFDDTRRLLAACLLIAVEEEA